MTKGTARITLKTVEVSGLLGVSKRQLQYWRDQRIVVPIKAVGQGKGGVIHLYTEREILAIMILRCCKQSGMGPKMAFALVKKIVRIVVGSDCICVLICRRQLLAVSSVYELPSALVELSRKNHAPLFFLDIKTLRARLEGIVAWNGCELQDKRIGELNRQLKGLRKELRKGEAA